MLIINDPHSSVYYYPIPSAATDASLLRDEFQPIFKVVILCRIIKQIIDYSLFNL